MYICDGLVMNLPPENKPQNVVYNIFSELTLKASLLFFQKIYWNCYRKILCKNWNPNRTLSINFMLKNMFSGKFAVKLKPETKRCVKICFAWQSELCVDLYFKFRKYYTVYNSGLKIWLVSGIFEMAQLFNLKFWLYLWRLGVAFSPHF